MRLHRQVNAWVDTFTGLCYIHDSTYAICAAVMSAVMDGEAEEEEGVDSGALQSLP